MIKKLLITLVLLQFATTLISQEMENDVGIDEKLGEMVPLDIEFTDEKGEKKSLKEISNGKPIILSMVYYRCPGICNVLLAGERDVIERSDLEPGQDYVALSVSMAHNETWDLARDKKENYLTGMTRKIQDDSWKWVVGDSASVANLTKSIGFKFKREVVEEGVIDYLHAGALIYLSPEGKVTRYLNGTEFLPFDFKMAAIEASEGKAMPTVNRILALCFKYDPEGRGYVLKFTQIFGGIFTLIIVGFIFWLVKSNKPVRS